jgi:hypothetical protein
MLLKRAVFRAGVLTVIVIGVTWLVAVLPRPGSQNSEVLASTIAMPYSVYAFVPANIIHALDLVVGGGIPQQNVPPPFSFWLRRGSVSIGREAIASALIAIIGTVVYGLLWYALMKASVRLRSALIIAMAVALVLVAARVPASMLSAPGLPARVSESVGRILTAPSAAILTALHVPIRFGRPGDSPTPLLTTEVARAAYVWLTCLLYWLLLALLSFLVARVTEYYRLRSTESEHPV